MRQAGAKAPACIFGTAAPRFAARALVGWTFHPHISGMALPRRISAFLPFGRVAALVAVLLLVGMAGAWALDFPRVGLPGQSDEAAMQTGFAVQWALFGGFSGQKGNALYYLALTAGVVGLMLIVTNAKYRSPPVLVSWFIILMLLLFAPYNSRLLFYPVKPGGTGCTAGVSTKSPSGGAIADANGVCGFTPQVIAAHLGTVITLIITDVFNSMSIQNAVEGALARQQLQNSAEMTPNKGALDELAKYNADKQCNNAPLQPACAAKKEAASSSTSASGTGASTAAAPTVPIKTMAQAFNDIYDAVKKAGQGEVAGTRTELPVIILPKTPGEGSSVAGWDSTETGAQWSSYKTGLAKIYGAVKAGNTDDVKSGKVNVSEAVDGIINKVRDKAFYGAGQLGWYFVTASEANNVSAVRGNPNMKVGSGVAAQFEGAGGRSDLPNTVRILKNLLADPEVSDMPVGVALVAVDPKTSLAKADKDGITDCAARASTYFNNILVAQLPNFSSEKSDGAGHKIVDQIMSCGTLSSSDLMSAGGRYQGFGQLVSKYATTTGAGDTVDAAGFGKFWMDTLQSNATRVNDPAAKTANVATSTPDNIGPLAKLSVGGVSLGSLLSGLGVTLAGIVGWLSGVLASAFLMVLRYLIDLMIMVILVATPLMFLMGLMIPTNAPGMLFTTVIGLLVLKLVPMTTKIVDFMIGVVRDMSWVTSSNGLSAAMWDGIILGAAAGMYMGVIGLTLFILFKLGDPSNIGQLRSLEGAAKGIAEAGKRAAIALGVGAATLGAGAAVGGISGGRAAARMAMSGTRLGKASEMLENLKASSEAKTEAATAAEAPVTGGTPTDGVKPGIPEVDITGDPAAEFARREADAAKAFGEDGLTQEMGKDAGGWQNVNGAFAEHLDMGGDPDGPRKVKTANGRTYTAELKDGKWVATGFEEGLSEGDTKLAQQVASLKNGEQATVTLSDGSTQTWARDENGALARVASTEAPAHGKDATVPAPTVVPTATGAGTVVRTPAGYVSEADAERFDALSKDNRATVEGLANGEKAEVTLSDKTTRTWERTDEGKLKQRASVEDDKHFKDFSDKLDRISTSIRDAIKQGFDQATMNRLGEDKKDAPLQSNAAFKAEIEALVNADVLSQAQAKKILNSSSYDEALKEVSDVRARQTEYLEKIGVAKNGDNFDGASAAWRGGLRGARSGLYGSIQAFKNAGGSLPVIGPIIKEILNEDREAHDRAVVIAMAGGMKDYKRSQKLAERNSFVNKEMSTLGGAESYRNNLVQAQYSNTIQAARQGAAKAVEDFTARARTGRTDSTGAFSFSDMRANARMGAVSEATSISTGAMSIKNANITLQGGRSVSLNPAVLQELGMRASLGDANKKIGGQFETSYAMEPKLDKRGVNDLRDGKQIGDYVQGSTGRDYVVSGVINNMGGRAGFMAKEAEALRMLEFAKGNMNNSELNKYFSMGAELKGARNYHKFIDPTAKFTKDDLVEAIADALEK